MRPATTYESEREYEAESVQGEYGQEMMPPDVIRQDTDAITECSGSTLEFTYPPLEIADYLSHYFPPA
jgi:hypothetical protein